ncbi:MAG TPA: acyltransferase [Pseudomonadota bacterium]|nr:acyltransferase [Pseudomonadota bacterium]
MNTLADGLARKNDNFLLLRFIAASMVIYGHAPAITGHAEPVDLFIRLNWGTYSGAIAVDVFFIVSGFLVTGSFVRNPRLADFAWARAIRIVPAYAVCLLLSAFGLGAAFTELPLRDYFQHPDTVDYVVRNLQFDTVMQWQLPGVFADNPKSDVVNGSIWTLPAEVRMYLLVAALGLAGALSWRALFNVVALSLLVLGWLYPERTPMSNPHEYLRLAALFVAGAFCFVNRDWMPLGSRLLPTLAVLTWLWRDTPVFPCLFAAAEVAFVFWFAYETRWRGFNRFGDYSYGIYLWGYPAQQMLAALAGGTHNYVNALGGLLIALALAVASWHLVEQPALRLKKLPNDIRKRWQAGQSGAVNRSGADKSGQELTSLDLQPAPAASAPASR